MGTDLKPPAEKQSLSSWKVVALLIIPPLLVALALLPEFTRGDPGFALRVLAFFLVVSVICGAGYFSKPLEALLILAVDRFLLTRPKLTRVLTGAFTLMIVGIVGSVLWVVLLAVVGYFYENEMPDASSILLHARAGTKAYLKAKGDAEPPIVVAKTQKDYENALRARKIGDTIGFSKTPGLMLVQPGTLVLILENDWLMVHIRVIQEDSEYSALTDGSPSPV